MPVLGALSPFLEPFCGHLSPKLDKVSEKLTFEIPPQRASGGSHLKCGKGEACEDALQDYRGTSPIRKHPLP